MKNINYYCNCSAEEIIKTWLQEAKILELKRKTEELKWRMIYDKIWKNYITSSFQEENND